jgi:putative redox protein
MFGRVEWKGESKVDCFNEAGDCIEIDWDNGPSPVQIVLQMIGACSLADVQIGLKDRKISRIWIELSGQRKTEAPKVFTAIEMNYFIEGDAPKRLVKRLVEKSHEKYCTVSNMFKSTVDISSNVFVNGETC